MNGVPGRISALRQLIYRNILPCMVELNGFENGGRVLGVKKGRHRGREGGGRRQEVEWRIIRWWSIIHTHTHTCRHINQLDPNLKRPRGYLFTECRSNISKLTASNCITHMYGIYCIEIILILLAGTNRNQSSTRTDLFMKKKGIQLV